MSAWSAKVKQLGIKECFIGIDTWGVDYCLLDQSGQLLDEPIAYRDGRTEAAVTNFSKGYSLENCTNKRDSSSAF